MRVLISTFGTHGDVQPFLALGRGLRAAGHEAAICTSVSYRPAIEALGITYAPLSDTMLRLTKALLAGDQGGTLGLMRQMAPAIRESMHEEWRAAQAFAPDLIVYHPKMLGSYHIAERLAVPAAMAIPLPFYTPTRAFPNPFFAGLRLGPGLNLLTYRLMSLAGAMYNGTVNRFRREALGLPPVGRFADLLTAADGRPIPLLYPYSSALLPTPADFPPHVHVTGYWFLDRAEGWAPPAELERFLAAGPPPVYVGFGSVGARKGRERSQLVLDALRQAGQRGVLARGWGGLQAADAPADVLLIDEAPHDWLFPHMAAVVHHGGAGTTAAGLRAGRPTLICPFFGDQPFWGRVVHERGLGPRPISQSELSAPRLAAAIREAVEDGEMRRRAAAVGEQIRGEDGVGAAIGLIERIAGAPAPSPALAAGGA
jgi:sterol 3beta-glucosyltransferase